MYACAKILFKALAAGPHTNLVPSSNKGSHTNKRWITMTRCAEEVTRDENIDLTVLVNYIKIDLFKKAKFVVGKDEWDMGDRIYNDFIKMLQRENWVADDDRCC